jgi:hypothetical protein
MAVAGKKVTWERADMALLAIMDLYECDDLSDYDPWGSSAMRTLDQAANAVREIRDQCPKPDGQPDSLRAFSAFAGAIDARQ